MSYEIVKSIKIRDDKVFVTSHSNNVSLRRFHEWECDSLTKILQEQGKDALEIEILEAYEEGNFQSQTGKYVRALQVLKHMLEYKAFDWHNGGFGDWSKYDKTLLYRKEHRADFEKLLILALNTRLPKSKFVISKVWAFGATYYLTSARRCVKWTLNKSEAKIFRFQEDAENLKKNYHASNDWNVEQINL